MDDNSTDKNGLFRLTWRTLGWVAGLNIIPTLLVFGMSGSMLLALFLWLWAFLPYSLAGSTSPLLRASVADRFVVLFAASFITGLLSFFVLIPSNALSSIAKLLISFAFGLAVPIIDVSYFIMYQFNAYRDRTGAKFSSLWEMDPTDI